MTFGSVTVATKISELNALGAAPELDDLLALVDSSATETKKITVQELRVEDVGTMPSGTTPAIDASNGQIQTWTLSGNSSPTDSLVSGEGVVLLIDDGTAYTITWPSVTWDSGSAPTLETTGFTKVVLYKVGSSLRGAY